MGEIRLKSPAAAYQFQQTTARMEIVLMLTQVLGEMSDAMGEKRYLHFSRPDISFVRLELPDCLLFRLFGYGHSVSPTQTRKSVRRDWSLTPKNTLRSRHQPPGTTPCQVYHTRKGPDFSGPLLLLPGTLDARDANSVETGTAVDGAIVPWNERNPRCLTTFRAYRVVVFANGSVCPEPALALVQRATGRAATRLMHETLRLKKFLLTDGEQEFLAAVSAR